MESEQFDTETALIAAQSLETVFSRRTHKRKFMGQIVLVPGQLGQALRLPLIIDKLRSKSSRRRQSGLEAFQNLWDTLSAQTREQALREIGWYDPQELPWDDKRSNRRPLFQKSH